MFSRIDDFLIDRVFQPLVIALGVEVRMMVRAVRLGLVGVAFGFIALAWIGQGKADVTWMASLALATVIACLPHVPKPRSHPFFFWLRMMFLFWLAVDWAVLGLIALVPVEGLLFSRCALMAVNTALWTALGYLEVCRDPPPRHRFAFAPAPG